MNKTVVFTLALLLSAAATGFSQKFGFCNSSALLAELPEVKAADSNLKDFQTQLTKKGQEMVKSLQDKAAELQRKQDQGLISPKDYEAQGVKLKEEEEGIAKYEQEVYEKLAKKREDLYKPLLEKVNTAMKSVATEAGFAMVFDAGSQVLLYADDTLDVTKLVKAKLGIAN